MSLSIYEPLFRSYGMCTFKICIDDRSSYGSYNGSYLGAKRDLYEGGIKSPMIVSWPGKIEAGSVRDHISASWETKNTPILEY